MKVLVGIVLVVLGLQMFRSDSYGVPSVGVPQCGCLQGSLLKGEPRTSSEGIPRAILIRIKAVCRRCDPYIPT